jgi:hypothetical protein
MSALLTDEAVRAAKGFGPTPDGQILDYDPPPQVARFLHYHATEGHEALVEKVTVALWQIDQEMSARVALFDLRYGHTSEAWDEADPLDQREFRERAEAVVTALVGDRP